MEGQPRCNDTVAVDLGVCDIALADQHEIVAKRQQMLTPCADMVRVAVARAFRPGGMERVEDGDRRAGFSQFDKGGDPRRFLREDIVIASTRARS